MHFSKPNFFLLDFEVMAHKFYGGIFLVVFISLILGTSFKCSELKVGGQTKTFSVNWKKYLKSFKNIEAYKWVDLERMWAFHAAVAAAANNHQAEYFIPGYLAFCPQYIIMFDYQNTKQDFSWAFFSHSSPLIETPRFHLKTEEKWIINLMSMSKPIH